MKTIEAPQELVDAMTAQILDPLFKIFKTDVYFKNDINVENKCK